jgi:hypothetical protein
MTHYTRAMMGSVLALALGLLLTGCVLRSLFAHVIIVSDLSDEINTVIDAVFADATVAVCNNSGSFYDCTYIVNGEILTSTANLLSESAGGLGAVLVDPLIAQVPDDVHTITATYNLGQGAGDQPLNVTWTHRFKVTHALSVTAEPGQRFIILELPPSVESMLPTGVPTNGLPISYTLVYAHDEPLGPPVPPQTVKLMLAGRVTLNGHKYYLPLLPCVTDFAQVPALTLPESPTPVDMGPALGALSASGCNNRVYFFNPEPPPRFLFLPLLQRP